MLAIVDIGPYRLLRELGRGGMAVVYEAERRGSGERIAVKVPHHFEEGAVVAARVGREVQAMARLSHPHILPIVDWGETATPSGETSVWIAMPLVEHVDFVAYAAKSRTADILARMDELLDALAYAHDRGVVHRDIKPHNILISSAGHLYLSDFGVADVGTKKSHLGEVAGTPSYMSPESLRGEDDVDATTDLYAVGAMLFYIFAGRHAQKKDVLERVASGWHSMPPPSFDEGAPLAIPTRLGDVILRLLAPDRLARFPSASAVRLALAGIDTAGGSSRVICAPDSTPTRTQSLTSAARVPASSQRLFGGLSATFTASRTEGTRRNVAVAALRLGESDRALVLAILLRSGAKVEYVDADVVAVFGTDASEGNEAMRVAELAFAVRSALRFGAETRGGLAVGEALIANGRATGAPIDTARALARDARQGEIRAPVGASVWLGSRYQLEPDERGALRLVAEIDTAKEAPAPLGRDRELAELDAIAARVRGQSVSALCTVAGRAGMGKSEFLRYFVRAKHERASMRPLADTALASRAPALPRFLVLQASALVTDSVEPIAPVRRAIRDAIGASGRGADPALVARFLADRWPEGLEDAAGDLALADDVARLVGIAPREPSRAESASQRARIFASLGAFFVRLTKYAPVLLAVDDLHWADDSTSALLVHLVELLRDRPFLVVVGSRNAIDLPHTDSIELAPLDDVAARALFARVAALPAARLAESSVALGKLVALAGGHPYHLTELARLVRSRLAAGASVESVLATVATEESMGAVLQARIDALSGEERIVLASAAVIGPSFWLPLLAALAPDAEGVARLAGVIASLEAQGLIELGDDHAIPGLPEARFAHQLLWERVHASVPAESAAPIHRFAASWLERNARASGGSAHRLIAEHWTEGGELARAAAWHMRAARSAEQEGAMLEARRSYERALDLVDTLGEQRGAPYVKSVDPMRDEVLPLDLPGLLIGTARMQCDCGALDRADATAARALALEERGRVLVEADALRIRAEVARSRGENDAALSWIEQALARLGTSGDRIMRALLLAQRGWILGYVLGRNDEGRVCGKDALALLSGLAVPAVEAHIYSFLGANELRAGEWDAQLECNRRALALATEAHDVTSEVRAHINLSVCFTNRGELALAAQHAESAIGLATRSGLSSSRIVATNNLGMIRLDQGKLDDAEALLRQTIELALARSTTEVLHETYPTLARVRLARADMEGARDLARRGRAISENEGNVVGVALALRVEALIDARSGDRETARAALEAALRTLGEGGDRYERAVTLLALAGVLGEDTSHAEAELRAVGADVAMEHARWVAADVPAEVRG